jgi:hypothetical protein
MVSYALARGSSRFNLQDRPELIPGLSNQLSNDEPTSPPEATRRQSRAFKELPELPRHQGARCRAHRRGPRGVREAGGFLARDWCDGTPLQPVARHSFNLHAQLAQEIGATRDTAVLIPMAALPPVAINPAMSSGRSSSIGSRRA